MRMSQYKTMNNLKISKRLLINGRSSDGLLQGKQRKEQKAFEG